MSKKSASTIPLAKRVAAGAIGAVLSFSMTIPFGATQAIAAESGATGEKSVTHGASTASTAKREVVYTKTDATGASGGSYVVNAFETPSKTDIQDPGTYDKLTNLTTDKKLEQSDGKVDLTTVAGEPFYYQGNLGKDTKLPWKVQITYRLDGKVVKPSELAGKDGRRTAGSTSSSRLTASTTTPPRQTSPRASCCRRRGRSPTRTSSWTTRATPPSPPAAATPS